MRSAVPIHRFALAIQVTKARCVPPVLSLHGGDCRRRAMRARPETRNPCRSGSRDAEAVTRLARVCSAPAREPNPRRRGLLTGGLLPRSSSDPPNTSLERRAGEPRRVSPGTIEHCRTRRRKPLEAATATAATRVLLTEGSAMESGRRTHAPACRRAPRVRNLGSPSSSMCATFAAAQSWSVLPSTRSLCSRRDCGTSGAWLGAAQPRQSFACSGASKSIHDRRANQCPRSVNCALEFTREGSS